jgi:hypothetical protein
VRHTDSVCNEPIRTGHVDLTLLSISLSVFAVDLGLEQRPSDESSDLLACVYAKRTLFIVHVSFSALLPSRPGHLLRLNHAPGSRLRSAFLVPPAGSSTIQNLSAGPANKALQLDWELGRLLFGCPREQRAAEKENIHVHTESGHDHRLYWQ